MATYWENSCSFGLRYVSRYKCLIVSLVFSYLGFWSGNLFLIAPFPDLCLLVLFENWTESVVSKVDSRRTEELTKCYEPLQKLRVRLWPCKIDLNPPVTLCY